MWFIKYSLPCLSLYIILIHINTPHKPSINKQSTSLPIIKQFQSNLRNLIKQSTSFQSHQLNTLIWTLKPLQITIALHGLPIYICIMAVKLQWLLLQLNLTAHLFHQVLNVNVAWHGQHNYPSTTYIFTFHRLTISTPC